MVTRTAPPHLDRSGKKLWREIARDYDLRPDEYRVLEDACREADLIEHLAEAQRQSPIMISGSMGQQVLNPLIGEVRQHRVALAGLLAKLKLPDDAGEVPAGSGGASGDDRATKARAAANARWSRRGA